MFWSWTTAHRVTVGVLGVLFLLVAAAAGVWWFVLRSPGTPVGLGQALRLYRANQKGKGAKSAELPPPGVYRYRTTGSEHLSVGGIERGFPRATEMIVTDGTCTTMTWAPLEQHTEGVVACPTAGGAVAVHSFLSYEVIAGVATHSAIRCPTGAWLLPPGARTGDRWRATCRSGRSPVALRGEVLGEGPLRVAGTTVPAIHLREVLTFTGAERGTNPTDYWISATNGVILRQAETVTLNQSAGPLGTVRYQEQMAIALSTLGPAR
jgi:hypothetical protein